VEELEQFSKLAFGREIKMIQLKQEINELRGQLGQGEKYEIVQ
jgi:two-component system CheB/CheR fusion protein